MFEFEVIQDLKLNDKILEIIKSYEYTVKNSKIIEIDSAQQNKACLYLFNSINFEIKNCKSLDIQEQMF